MFAVRFRLPPPLLDPNCSPIDASKSIVCWVIDPALLPGVVSTPSQSNEISTLSESPTLTSKSTPIETNSNDGRSVALPAT